MIFSLWLDTIYQIENQVITSGSIALLKGADLKFDWQDKDQGIFLVDSEGSTIRADFYSDVNDASVRFVVPQLKSGESYQVLLKIFDPATGDKIEKPLERPVVADVEPDPEWTPESDGVVESEVNAEVSQEDAPAESDDEEVFDEDVDEFDGDDDASGE